MLLRAVLPPMITSKPAVFIASAILLPIKPSARTLLRREMLRMWVYLTVMVLIHLEMQLDMVL
jgi:hypothetical protein